MNQGVTGMMRPRGSLVLVALLGVAGCTSDHPASIEESTESPSLGVVSNATKIPLTDQVNGNYLGFPLGLYNGSNTMPAAHDNTGRVMARRIKKLNTAGQSSATGKIILLSVGMSGAAQEWCGKHTLGVNCTSWSAQGSMMLDATRTSSVVVFNGADGAQVTDDWATPQAANYPRVAGLLANNGYSEKQVQVIWVKLANRNPTISLPSPQADAYAMERSLGNVMRTLKIRYPNLKQVFITARIYGGYVTTPVNPEPWAYETGFAVKWLIDAQIRQMATGVIDAESGNLDYRTVAPWIAWAPYMWADGTTPRADGLTWPRSDFEIDGMHASTSGETKVAGMVRTFFQTSVHTSCWYKGLPC
jgi:hypothetical protein